MDESWTFKMHACNMDFPSPPLKSAVNLTVRPVIFQAKTDMPSSLVCLRWRCHGRPVSQRTLPAPGGSPLPQPLNVAPSLSSLPVKDTPFG